jgi:hypothetical protein
MRPLEGLPETYTITRYPPCEQRVLLLLYLHQPWPGTLSSHHSLNSSSGGSSASACVALTSATCCLRANPTSQLVLAIINISPWIIAIVYDIVLYVARRLWHEIPVWGGRARGDARPRAPSLRDRSRRLSFAELIRGSSVPETNSDARDEVRGGTRHM